MRQIKPGVYAVGAIDWDRRLFDELIPLPGGTSYNSYLVKASEKTVLLDTVDPAKTDVLLSNLAGSGIDGIDYIVAHHGEQDHSGSIPPLLSLYAEARIVTNPRCKGMLMDHLGLKDERFITVEDGETLSLGDKNLKFIYTPWVHWPETMCSYLQEDKILFSCDFFGAHLARSPLFVDDEATTFEAAKRYYAEIMMPFRKPIQTNLKKLADLDIEMIAPSHGQVYNNPALIMDAYRQWTSEDVKNEVVVAYVSMHDSVKKMTEYLVDALIQRDIKVMPYNLVDLDTGQLAMALIDAATVIIASPTVLVGAHPKAAYAAILANAIRPKVKFAGMIGSFGWAGKMTDQLASLLTNLQAEMLEPVLSKGQPDDDVYEALEKLADTIHGKHQALGIC